MILQNILLLISWLHFKSGLMFMKVMNCFGEHINDVLMMEKVINEVCHQNVV